MGVYFKNGLILIKFMPKEYISSFLDGNLYMNSLQYYIDLENRTGVSGQGDKLEGSIPICDKVISNSNVQIKINVRYSAGYQNVPVFCMMYLEPNPYTLTYMITNEQQYKEMRSFSKDCVIIYDVEKFNNRFESACRALKYKFGHSLVHYMEENKDKDKKVKKIILKDDNRYKSVFCKDNKFKLQQEYRLAIFENIETPYTLNIGDIRDISKVCRIEKFCRWMYPK